MSVTISPQLRLLAIIGGVLALAGAGALMLMGRSSGSSAAPHVIKPLHPVAKHVATTHRAKTHAAKKAHAVRPAHKAAAKPKPKPAATRAPKVVKAAPKPSVVTVKGLPKSLVRALTAHPVVVVALYQVSRTATAAERAAARNGTSSAAAVGIDQLALAEAQQGARDAHVGFLGVNVFRQADAAPLTKMLGVLQDPALLVFKRPGTVFVQLNGFVDKDTVAQAAANAALQQ